MDIDESVIGLTSEPFIFEVEKGHIRKFADSIGDSNPLYRDEEYADKTTYGGIIAPPTFPIAIASEVGEMPMKLDTRRMLQVEQSFIYERVIQAGDKLRCHLKVSYLYEKEGKSGKMQFLILDTEMKDEEGKLVVTSRMNIIYRPLKKA